MDECPWQSLENCLLRLAADRRNARVVSFWSLFEEREKGSTRVGARELENLEMEFLSAVKVYSEVC